MSESLYMTIASYQKWRLSNKKGEISEFAKTEIVLEKVSRKEPLNALEIVNQVILVTPSAIIPSGSIS